MIDATNKIKQAVTMILVIGTLATVGQWVINNDDPNYSFIVTWTPVKRTVQISYIIDKGPLRTVLADSSPYSLHLPAKTTTASINAYQSRPGSLIVNLLKDGVSTQQMHRDDIGSVRCYFPVRPA